MGGILLLTHAQKNQHAQEVRTTLAKPLMQAALRHDVNEMRLLLDKGAAVNEVNGRGFAAIDYASDAIPPYFDKSHGSVGAVSLLLDRGAKPDIAGEGGITPLMSAANRGDVEIARVLLAHGANVNHVSRYGWTALAQAVLLQQPDMVEFLLLNGADPNIGVESGNHNLLTIAKTKGNKKIIELLEKAGARNG